MHTIELMDSWSASGTDFKEFQRMVERMAKNTYVANVRTNSLMLLHYLGLSPTNDDKMLFSVHSEQQVTDSKRINTALYLSALRDSGMDEKFIKEIQDSTKLICRMGGYGAQRNDFYFTSKHLSRDIAARAELGGDAVYDPTDERETYIMSRYIKSPVNANAVIRRNGEDGNVVHKIFALPSSTYCYIEQTILLEMAAKLAAELGDFVCDKWYIDHFITQVWLTFPEHADDVCETYGIPAEFVPGVLLETSDTGDCSVRAIAFWQRKGSNRARIGMYEREHRGSFDERMILTAYQKKLMGRYLELPQRLAELLSITVPDSAAAIEAILRMVHASKELGKKRAQSLLEAMQAEVSAKPSMSAYELAMLFMDLPARIIDDKTYLEVIENIAGKVPFLDFSKVVAAKSGIALS